MRVCKLFFMNTLSISNQVNKSAQSKCNDKGELIVRDRRGTMRHQRLNKDTPETNQTTACDQEPPEIKLEDSETALAACTENEEAMMT